MRGAAVFQHVEMSEVRRDAGRGAEVAKDTPVYAAVVSAGALLALRLLTLRLHPYTIEPIARRNRKHQSAAARELFLWGSQEFCAQSCSDPLLSWHKVSAAISAA